MPWCFSIAIEEHLALRAQMLVRIHQLEELIMLNLPYETIHHDEKTGMEIISVAHFRGVDELLEFMREVVYGEKVYEKDWRTGSKKKIPRRKELESYRKELGRFYGLGLLGYTYHPLIHLFFQVYHTHPILGCENLNSQALVDGRSVGEIFQDFLGECRVKSKLNGFKKRVSNWDGKHAYWVKRVDSFEQELFDQYARATVIRLDFGYRDDGFSADPNRALGDPTGVFLEKFKVSFDTLKSDRERFFSYVKGKPELFRHFIAYAWKMECTPAAGYHLHLVLFFDGREVQKHEWLAREIGEWWNETITKGRGRYWNVNAEYDKNSLTYGIGKVDNFNIPKRAFLKRYVLGYLVKDLQVIQVLPRPGVHLFHCGFVRKKKKSTRGAPRKTQRKEGAQGDI